MRRRRPYRDTTAERASISKLGFLLNEIQDRRQVGMVIFIVIWGLSFPDAARRLGISEREARRLLHNALSRLRHPSHLANLREELGGDDFVSRSVELRRWVQAAAQTMLVTCPRCERRFMPENIFYLTGGRPRRYCSNACRQAAYRARQRTP